MYKEGVLSEENYVEIANPLEREKSKSIIALPRYYNNLLFRLIASKMTKNL